MKYLVLSVIAVVGVAATSATGYAETARRIHKHHIYRLRSVSEPRGAVRVNPDPTGGNAAAGGNNANSMSGSNSANENAIGRTSGGGGRS
jgi:hypothetical protein